MSVRRNALAALIVAIASAAPFSGAFASDEWRIIDQAGKERRYLIHTPEAGASAPRAAVIVLHGGGGDAKNAIRMTGFSEKADKEGFIAVYPNGSSKRFDDKLLTWNARHCCAAAMKQNVDDVGFISALIDEVVERDGVDPGRVYVTGMSNGAMMSHRAGIELSKKIAVIAPVVGTMFGDEPEARSPVAALIINGTKDTQIKIEGGQNNSRFKDAWDGTPMKPALWQSQYWAKNNGCKPTPKKTSIKPSVILYDYECPKGYDVRQIILENGTHSWPGGRKGYKNGADPTTEINATDEIWAFLIEMTG